MAILDNQITSGEINNAHVQKQPDRLEGTAQANKAAFDILPELIANKYNSALTEIKTELDAKDTNLANLRQELEEEIHSDPTIDPETERKSAYNKNFENDASNLAMNGTASSGFLDTVARGDHVHPTDTTRASQAAVNDVASRVSTIEETMSDTIEIVDTINNTSAVISVTESQTNGAVTVKKKPLSGDGTITTVEVPVHGLGTSAFKNVADTYDSTGTDPVSGIAVAAAIEGAKIKMVSASRTMVAQSAGAKGNFHLDWSISSAPFAVYCTTSSVGYANGAIFSVINVGNTGVYVNYYFPNATTNSFVVQVKAAYVEY